MYEIFENKRVLITGGTGSFGQALVKALLTRANPAAIIVLSRDEMKQWYMAEKFDHHEKLRFFIGDVREYQRLRRAFADVDFVIHAAATKIITAAEYNPFECIKTNVYGAENVINAAIDCGVQNVVALSTDKACSPINLYGASKLASDKLFVAGNAYAAKQTKLSVVRYGNVMGSRGSVIPFFLQLSKNNPYRKFPITDIRMTRFMISLDEAIDLVILALEKMIGGEIFIKKIPSMKVIEIAQAIDPDREIEIVGIRPGEKLHEEMIVPDDARNTIDCGDYYVITPDHPFWDRDSEMQNSNQLVEPNFHYRSDINPSWMSVPDLQAWLSKYTGPI